MGYMMPCQKPAQNPAGSAPESLYFESGPATAKMFGMILFSPFQFAHYHHTQKAVKNPCRETKNSPDGYVLGARRDFVYIRLFAVYLNCLRPDNKDVSAFGGVCFREGD